MSRVGKKPVAIPQGVEIQLLDGVLKAKGKLGEQQVAVHPSVSVAVNDNGIVVSPKNNSKEARSMWGTTRSLMSNLVQGVSEGISVKLNISGVGYRAAVQGSNLQLNLGFSHDVKYPIPQGVTIKCENPTTIVISGNNKQQIGQIASEIRSYRRPEPYKGKGISYEGEYILRKEGKKK